MPAILQSTCPAMTRRMICISVTWMELASSKDWENNGYVAATASAIAIELDTHFVVHLVEVAEAVAAEGGGSAMSAVNLDVLTPIWKSIHIDLLPLPPRSLGIMGLAGF